MYVCEHLAPLGFLGRLEHLGISCPLVQGHGLYFKGLYMYLPVLVHLMCVHKVSRTVQCNFFFLVMVVIPFAETSLDLTTWLAVSKSCNNHQLIVNVRIKMLE